MALSLWKTVWQLLTKLSIILPYDPVIVVLDIYSIDLKIYVYNTWMQIFTTAFFIIVKNCKQSSVDDWINKL